MNDTTERGAQRSEVLKKVSGDGIQGTCEGTGL